MSTAPASSAAPAADGIVVVDKPAGPTSHDVVARVRRIMGTRRVGHAGTLDPMATGVLVVGVGKATRLLHHLLHTDKTYEATVRLGQATVTDDATGDIVSSAPTGAVPDGDVRRAVSALTGRLEQVPSSVSAIKVDGRRAYRRVRDGAAVELAARPVTVYRFDVRGLRRDGERLDVDVVVECSSGTYVRALARDLGAALGVGGHLTALRRTRVGPFGLSLARTLDHLAADPVCLPLADAVRAALPVREVDADEAWALSHGRPVAASGAAGVHGALTAAGEAVALLRDEDGLARPVLVFTAAG